jgi:hypothetical protein
MVILTQEYGDQQAGSAGRESNEINFASIIGNPEFNVCEKWYPG